MVTGRSCGQILLANSDWVFVKNSFSAASLACLISCPSGCWFRSSLCYSKMLTVSSSAAFQFSSTCTFAFFSPFFPSLSLLQQTSQHAPYSEFVWLLSLWILLLFHHSFPPHLFPHTLFFPTLMYSAFQPAWGQSIGAYQDVLCGCPHLDLEADRTKLGLSVLDSTGGRRGRGLNKRMCVYVGAFKRSCGMSERMMEGWLYVSLSIRWMHGESDDGAMNKI